MAILMRLIYRSVQISIVYSMLIAILAVLVVGIVVALYYFDLLSKKEITHNVFSECVVLYKDWQGDIDTVGNEFSTMSNELKSRIGASTSLLLGIYYDDPKKVVDKTKARCIIGYLLEIEEQKVAAQAVVSSNDKYKTKPLPYHNSLT